MECVCLRGSHGDKSAVLVLQSPLKRTGVSAADEIEKELGEALVRAERLRQSILKNAFEGKLV